MDKQETQFRIGGFYRQRNGWIVRLNEDAIAVRCTDGKMYGPRSLRDGSDGNALLINPECGDRSLLPGELTQVNGEWIAAEAPKPAQTFCDVLQQALDKLGGPAVITQVYGAALSSLNTIPAPRPHFAAAIEQMTEPDEPKTAEPKSAVQQIRELAATQISACDCVNDPYFRGLYNGLELALAVLEPRDPVYVEKPQPAQPKAPAFAALSLDGPSAFRAPVAKV